MYGIEGIAPVNKEREIIPIRRRDERSKLKRSMEGIGKRQIERGMYEWEKCSSDQPSNELNSPTSEEHNINYLLERKERSEKSLNSSVKGVNNLLPSVIPSLSLLTTHKLHAPKKEANKKGRLHRKIRAASKSYISKQNSPLPQILRKPLNHSKHNIDMSEKSILILGREKRTDSFKSIHSTSYLPHMTSNLPAPQLLKQSNIIYANRMKQLDLIHTKLGPIINTTPSLQKYIL